MKKYTRELTDAKHKIFTEMVDTYLGALPRDLSDSTREILKGQFKMKLIQYNEDLIDNFCESANLCPVCISGGWDCNSDHK